MQHTLWKGLVAGSVAGLTGAVAMTGFQKLWSQASEKIKRSQDSSSDSGRSGENSEGEDATMKAAEKIAEISGRSLTYEQKKNVGPVVHYAFGSGMGTLYGTIMEFAPRGVRHHDLLSGIGFGGALFAVADELAVPALGLSGKPSESPVSSHVYALASHLVYGITAGVVRKTVRAAL